MSCRNKTTTIREDTIPLAQASLLNHASELGGEVRREDILFSENPDLDSNNEHFLEANNSVGNTIESIIQDVCSVVTSSDPTIQDPDRYRHLQLNYHQNNQEDAVSPNNIQASNIDASTTNGAWAAGIVLGFLIGGPSVSVAFGVGAAFYSQQEEGVAADIAKTFGTVAIFSHEKFGQVIQKHDIVNNISTSTVAMSKKCFDVVRNTIDQFLNRYPRQSSTNESDRSN